jgi:hypothetical protein
MPRNVKKVAVVGGGLMGSGIATTLILNHYNVMLKEANEKLLNAGVDRIKGTGCRNCIHSLVIFFLWFIPYLCTVLILHNSCIVQGKIFY